MRQKSILSDEIIGRYIASIVMLANETPSFRPEKEIVLSL